MSQTNDNDRVLNVVICYDCSFEGSWEDLDTAIDQRDQHKEENNHEVYLERERVRKDNSPNTGSEHE